MAFITEGNKKQIDLMASAIFAGAVIWFFYKRNNGKLGKIEWIITAIAAALGYIVISQLTNTALVSSSKPGKSNVATDYLSDPDFDPTPITNGLNEAIDNSGFWVSDYGYDAYAAALALSNSELAMVYDDWTDRYFESNDNKTLTQAAQGQYIYMYVANGNDTIVLRNQLISRLQSMDLN